MHGIDALAGRHHLRATGASNVRLLTEWLTDQMEGWSVGSAPIAKEHVVAKSVRQHGMLHVRCDKYEEMMFVGDFVN